ncbi:MAG TPA: patatin-like phospholipase family protein [Candidatus Sulfomarinibacteraceae bacterium]|nr:patatin-like phospholipase family protein [Candidatus Sulfomarinibacteraceae bacterium]
MKPYRILTIDGGGIRGLLTCVILQRLQEAAPGWLDSVDLLAGTSTGGIIILGLAHGLTPTTLRNLYYEKGPVIFDDSWADDLVDLGKMIGADYDIEPLQEELEAILGDTRLGQLPKRVLVSAFDLDNEHPDPTRRHWKPKFFHNFPGIDSDADIPAYKVALYTSAAPTYFPTVDGFIDGGVAANNPSMAALTQTQDRRAEMIRRPALEEIVLLSLGTGQPSHFIEGARHDWGYAQWAKPLLNIMLDGASGIADYQCRQILGDRYHRLSPLLPQPIELDQWQRRGDLVRLGERLDLSDTIKWLEEQWQPDSGDEEE